MKKLIVTVTLNAAIDKVLICPDFQSGTINRVEEVIAGAGGKGLNVARIVKKVGGDALIIGYIGGLNGQFIEEELNREKLAHRFVKIKDNSRICYSILGGTKNPTQVHEPAPNISEDEWERLKQLIRALNTTRIFTLNGSLPRGLSAEAYKELTLFIRKVNPGCKVFLDASGPALKEGIAATPFMVKPNKDEMEELLGISIKSADDQLRAVSTVMEMGVQLVILSLGEEGVIFGTQGKCYKIEPLPCPVTNTVGCGDALVGGIASKLVYKNDIIDAVKFGAAAATANLLTRRPGDIDVKKVNEFYAQIKVKELVLA